MISGLRAPGSVVSVYPLRIVELTPPSFVRWTDEPVAEAVRLLGHRLKIHQLDGQIKSNRRRGVCARLHAEQIPEIRNRWPDGRNPWARLSESRNLSTSSFRNSTIRLHDVQCK